MKSLRHARAALCGVIGVAAMTVAPSGPASAQSASCDRLAAQLAKADRDTGGGSAQLRKWQRAVELQERALASTRRQAGAAGCSTLNRASAVCRGLNTKIGQMQTNLRKLRAGVKRYSGPGANQRQIRAIKARMARLRCGQDRREEVVRYEARSEERRPSGLFGLLFRSRPRDHSLAGYRPLYDVPEDPRSIRERQRSVIEARARQQAEEIDPDNPFNDRVTVSGGAFRTLCVRTCDGYYFPISYSTTKSNFYRDQLICQQMCPGTKVELFVHRSPGEESEDMTTVSGQPYAAMDYAFAYRKAFNPSCSCGRVTPSMTPIDANNLPTPRTIAGQIQVSIRGDQLKSGEARVDLPVPMKKLPADADPDTVDNLRGNFSPLAIASPDSKIASSVTRGDRRIRIVGPEFFADQ